MKGLLLLWELPLAGVSTAVRLARLPDLETRFPITLEGRLLEDMVWIIILQGGHGVPWQINGEKI